MPFQPIDMSAWKRRSYFEHFLNTVPCGYSATTDLDITRLATALQTGGFKSYPALIHALCTIVNRHAAFRTAFGASGEPGIWDDMHPAYTIFSAKHETFSSIWTEYHADFTVFHERYLHDCGRFADIPELFPKPDTPENVFPISSLPWVPFTAFNLNVQSTSPYLLPIFTFGKFRKDGKAITVPLSSQVHHAVCDGYHLGQFLQDLQNHLNEPEHWL